MKSSSLVEEIIDNPGMKARKNEERIASSIKTCLNKASRVVIPKVCPPLCFPASARGAEFLDANVLTNNLRVAVEAFETMEPSDNRAPFTGGIDAGAGGHRVLCNGHNKYI